MRRYHSLLEKPPRPKYEKDFGHQLEDIIGNFIEEKIPGLKCEHASESEDLTEGKDLIVSVPGTEIQKAFQVTMTSNPERLAIKGSRGVPLIIVPKEAVEKAWGEFKKEKEENPDLTFSYQFLPPQAQESIVRGLIKEPAIKRYLLRRAQERGNKAVSYP